MWPWVEPAAGLDPELRDIFRERIGFNFKPLALALDVAIALAIGASATAGFELWRRQRRHIFQFRIAELLVAVGVFAACLAYVKVLQDRRQQRQTAILAIEKLGGSVVVDPGGPGWLQDVIGGKGQLCFLDRPAGVYIGRAHEWCGVGLVALVDQNAKIGDAELVPLGELDTISELDLSYTQVTDGGLSTLTPLNRLEKLSLAWTKVTDAGVYRLAQLKTLKELDLRGTRVTEQGLQDLRFALPHCKFETDEDHL